jgi:hypothetical protein
MEHKNESMVKYTMNRPLAGSMCGVAVVVLAILGLVHVFPLPLAAIATIVFGVALLFKGAVVSSEYSRLISHLPGSTLDTVELGGGMSLEIMTGIAGIVLGILAILHLIPETLISIAIIVFGTGAVMGSGVVSRLNALKIEGTGTLSQNESKLAQDMVSAAVGTQILSGIAAIVLGILSLTGYYPLTLSLVALLVLGADAILSGSAVLERLAGKLHA